MFCTTSPASSTPQMGNELDSDVKLAAQIVLGVAILVITLRLALPRFQQVELVLELISRVVGTLDRIVVLFLRLIRDLHQISTAHEGFQQVVSVLELIHHVVGPFVNFVVLLLQLIRICKRIWSIWSTARARQPVVVANGHQNEVPLADINYGQNDIPLTDAEANVANGKNDIPLTDAEGDATNGKNNVIVNKELNI